MCSGRVSCTDEAHALIMLHVAELCILEQTHQVHIHGGVTSLLLVDSRGGTTCIPQLQLQSNVSQI